MTAEIAILNRTAVALAADSAGAIDKLFALSKYHPVGVMIYNNLYKTGIPWEAIIKTYRNELSKRSFPTLEDYAKDFIRFLDDHNPLFSEEIQDRDFIKTTSKYLYQIEGRNKRKRS